MMREAQLRQALLDLAAQGAPGEPDLWPGIRTRLVEERARSGWRWAITERSAPHRRSRWKRLPSRAGVLTLALVGLLLAGTGYAALPLIQQNLSGSPEGQQMLAYGKTMHMMRTVAGFTVSLEFAYADQTGGLLGYTITASDGRAFGNELAQVTLTTPDGTNVPITGGSGTGAQAGLTGNFIGFGSIPDLNGRNEAPLRLSVNALETNWPNGISQTVVGPWVFDFTAPIAPTRFIEPHQTVVADDWAVTLESILMTPPGTWVTLRGAGPDADVEILAGGKSYHLYESGDGATGAGPGRAVKLCFAAHRRCPDLWKDLDATYEAVAMEPACSLLCRLRGDKPGLQEDKAKTAEWMRELRQAHGEWTIVVRPDPSFTNPIFALRGGPWVFHVRIP